MMDPSDSAREIPSLRGVRLTEREFRAFRALLLETAGVSLADSKLGMVESRLARRLRHHEFGSYGEYYDYVMTRDPRRRELREMINCLTTNKTSFFREDHHFDFLEEVVFGAAPVEPLRIWSAGCSTGQEPYSMAMVAWNYFGPGAARRVGITATDIDTQVLSRASAGIYPGDELSGVPDALLQRFFLRGKGELAGRLKAKPILREMIEFRRLNLIEDRWDLVHKMHVIFCRNVIIYFNRETQQRLLERFADQLLPNGYLILGHSENIHWFGDTFEPLRNTVYRLRHPRPASDAGRAGPATRSGERPGIVRIEAGQIFATNRPIEVRTLLGSCVTACLFDPVAAVGGMNHFMLPECGNRSDEPARYGTHAMELLINEIMKRGGDRSRIEAKVFGGARVLNLGDTARHIGGLNCAFVREFLAREGIPIQAEKLGGESPLEVRMIASTGRVRVRTLNRALMPQVALNEARQNRLTQRQVEQSSSGGVTLF